MIPEAACSFCRAPRSRVKKLIEGGFQTGFPVFICDTCVRLARSPFATVAHCASCRVQHGKHAPDCPDQEISA